VFVLGHLALKQAETALFARWKFQAKLFECSRFWGRWSTLPWIAFSDAWRGHSPHKNSIAETIVVFVLRHLASKLAETAFACWKFQGKFFKRSRFWGRWSTLPWIAFSDAWHGRSP
jgi:hypothetical protein